MRLLSFLTLSKNTIHFINSLSFSTTRSALPKSSAGFTLIEALIAIAILLIAAVGPLSIVSKSIQTSNIGKDQITSFYLAQEALEYVRSIRDTNNLRALSWLNGLDVCKGVNVCQVDIANIAATPQPCSGACSNMNLIPGPGNLKTYGYVGGTQTTFVRSINIVETSPNIEAVITVTMSWQTGITPRSFKVTERIFNWSS